MGAAIGAADVWETKPFIEWTNKELKEFLEESPWVGKASLTHATPGGGARPIDDTIRLTWLSALPVRQARVRELAGMNGTPTGEMDTFLATTGDLYEIAFRIEGVSAGAAVRSVVPIAKETFISRKRKDPIPVFDVQMIQLDRDGKPIEAPPPPAPGAAPPGAGRGGRGSGPTGGSTILVFGFRKTDPITVDEEEVEVVSKIGQYNVKKKFKLKDMVVKGELAL
jgi:hypothetical protein